MKPFELKRIESINSFDLYQKWINWVVAEFDLQLIDDSDGITVYFPMGFFSINRLSADGNIQRFQIQVFGKQKQFCEAMIDELLGIRKAVLSC